MSRRFSFVQFEFPWVLGPSDGRLVLRADAGGEPQQIVVLATLGAQQRRLLATGRRQRRPQPAEAGNQAPAPVTTSRATVIDVAALEAEDVGGDWLDRADVYQAAADALEPLNRVIHAHRIATADPYVHPLALSNAIVVRVGFGDGEQVAEGRWTRAVELPQTAIVQRIRRPSSALRPQERLAAILGGRDEALHCEELALRARLDLDSGRLGAAALGVRHAMESALVELPNGRRDLAERIAELRELRAAAASQEVDVRHALERLEAALRARTAHGLL